MRLAKQRGRRAGLTVVEVAFALGVLMILLAGLFTTLSMSRSAEEAAREDQAATEAVFRVQDDLAALPYDTLIQAALDTDEDPLAGWVAVPQFAFGVQRARGGQDMAPASDDFEPLNIDWPDSVRDESTLVGHVYLRQDPDDHGADGEPSENLLEIRVIAAWRAADGGERRVESVTRRTR
jgi:hypothetical protein